MFEQSWATHEVHCKILAIRAVNAVNKMVYVSRVSSSLVTRNLVLTIANPRTGYRSLRLLRVTFALHLRQTSIAGTRGALLASYPRQNEFSTLALRVTARLFISCVLINTLTWCSINFVSITSSRSLKR